MQVPPRDRESERKRERKIERRAPCSSYPSLLSVPFTPFSPHVSQYVSKKESHAGRNFTPPPCAWRPHASLNRNRKSVLTDFRTDPPRAEKRLQCSIELLGDFTLFYRGTSLIRNTRPPRITIDR